jgi:hypothetical protein
MNSYKYRDELGDEKVTQKFGGLYSSYKLNSWYWGPFQLAWS